MVNRRSVPPGLCDLVISDDWDGADVLRAAEETDRQGEGSAAEFEAAKNTLQAAFRTYDTGSVLATFGMLGAASALGRSDRRIELAHVELAAAFALHFPTQGVMPTSAALRTMADALERYVDLYPRVAWRSGDDAGSRSLAVRRRQTFRVRHTAHPQEAVAIFDRIVGALGTDTVKVLGAKADRTLLFVQQAANLIAKRIDDHGLIEPFLSWFEEGDEPCDPGCLWVFDLYAEELEEHALPEFAPGAVRRIVDRLALKPGDLEDGNLEHLHLDNPVRTRPFVAIGDRRYCFSPSSVPDSQSGILERLLVGSTGAVREKLGAARGDALEAMAVEAIRRMLPSAVVLDGWEWTDPRDGRGYESDVIVLLDDVVMIFEAKGNVVSDKSMRGSETWFKDLDRIVVEACEQAHRLDTLLSDDGAKPLALTKDGETLTIDPATVHGVVRFGVALERVTFGSYVPGTFLHDRIAAAGVRPMPMFTIGDLWQIEQLLDDEAQRFHFLMRRAQLEDECAFAADEQDLLALYLLNGFNDPRLVGRTLEIYGLSAKLAYYQKGSPHHDPRVPAPTRTIPLWRHLLSRSRRFGSPDRSMIAYDLLDFTKEEQERFRTDLLQAKRLSRANGSRRGLVVNKVHKTAIRHPIALVCVTGARLDASDTGRELDRIWTGLLEEHRNCRVLLLLQDIDLKRPYPVLARYRGTPWRDRRPEGGAVVTAE